MTHFQDEFGRSWGQYFCDVSYEFLEVTPDEIYALTLDMDGRSELERNGRLNYVLIAAGLNNVHSNGFRPCS